MHEARGAGEAGAQMVRLCHGHELPKGNAAKVYLLLSRRERAK